MSASVARSKSRVAQVIRHQRTTRPVHTGAAAAAQATDVNTTISDADYFVQLSSSKTPWSIPSHSFGLKPKALQGFVFNASTTNGGSASASAAQATSPSQKGGVSALPPPPPRKGNKTKKTGEKTSPVSPSSKL